jgi:hypothetical protein
MVNTGKLVHGTSNRTSNTSEVTYDIRTIRRAAHDVSEIIRQYGEDSVVGMLLSQTLREIRSLEPSAASSTPIATPSRLVA